MVTVEVNSIIRQRLAPGKTMKDLLTRVDKEVKLKKKFVLDFKNVMISELLTTDDNFKKLLLDKKYDGVNLVFYNEKKLVTMGKLLLQLSDGRQDKIENVEPTITQTYQTAEEVYVATAKSKRLETKLKTMGMIIDDDKKCITLHYHKTPDKKTIILDGLNTKDSVIAIRDALLSTLNETGYKRAVVDFDDMQLFQNRSEAIAAAMCNLFNSFVSKKYEIEFKLFYEEDRRLLEMMHEIPSMSTDESEILEKIDSNLEVGSIGLLSEYVQKDSKTDKFGHYGNGKVATRQPAIYLGRDGAKLKFRVYDAHTFLRRIDVIVKQKEQAEQGIVTLSQNDKFKYKDVEIELSTIGICKFCNGNRYYFSLAIQTKDNEFIGTHYKKDDGTFGVVNMTLPVYIESVLTEQNQQYNAEMMMLCIEETKRRLECNDVEIEDLSNYNLNAI